MTSPEERTCPHCAESIKREAKICRYCQRDVPPLEQLSVRRPPLFDKPPRSEPLSARRKIGYTVIALGTALMLYSLNLDPSVPVWGGMNVNNIGLLNDKHNWVVASGVLILTGVIIAFAGEDR